jgi:predicted RecA/RadA family phage recombinase
MKNRLAVGKTIKLTGLTTGHSAGDLVIVNGFPGVIVADITGTTEQETTINGKPISGALGDGKGDLEIEGVFQVVDENPTALTDGTLVSRNSASGVVSTTGSNLMGHVIPGGGRYQEDGVDYVNIKLLGRPHIPTP